MLCKETNILILCKETMLHKFFDVVVLHDLLIVEWCFFPREELEHRG